MLRDRYRYFWQRPRTHRQGIAERRVSFLELFYDLIYVVLIARIALALHGEVTVRSTAVFIVLFSLLWIGWYNGSLLHDAHGRPDVRNRLLTFLQMSAIAAMGVFATDVTGNAGGRAFAICYTVFLAILVWQWLVVARLERTDPLYGPIAVRYAAVMAAMTVWIALSIPAPATTRLWMWGGFVAVFLVGMLLVAFTRRNDAAEAEAGRPLATESLLERFALFVIIVLGEVVASVVNGLASVHDLSAKVFFTGFAGLAVGIAFWWSYFDLIGMRAPIATVRARYLYNLAQLPLCLALTGVGAAILGLIEHADEASTPAPTARMFGGFVAATMLTAACLMRLLADYRRLASLYRPMVALTLVIAGLALALAARQPDPLAFTLILFLAMSAQWAFGVRLWLDTTEGRAQVAAVEESPRQGPTNPV
jgi:low temperature requirement protein LtrA